MTEEQTRIKRIQLAGFSGYGKSEHSKCKRPEKYGIRRTEDAERAFNGLPPKTRRNHNGKFQNRLCFRLPDDEYMASEIYRGYILSFPQERQDKRSGGRRKRRVFLWEHRNKHIVRFK